jgi:hypothetical protein
MPRARNDNGPEGPLTASISAWFSPPPINRHKREPSGPDGQALFHSPRCLVGSNRIGTVLIRQDPHPTSGRVALVQAQLAP